MADTKASTKKKTEQPEAVENEAQTTESEEDTSSAFPEVNNFNMVLITGLGLVLLVIIVMLASNTTPEEVAVANEPETSTTIPGPGTPAPTAPTTAASAAPSSAAEPAPAAPTPAASPNRSATGDVVGDGVIERKGEGRHFYTTISIPPGAETLYLSGSGARQQADGTWGDMEQQTIDTFTRFKSTLEAEGWSMSDIVQVRAFAVAGEYGLLDFDGFNRGYREFFGTEENPMKPVRSFVQIAGLVVPGWLVEIEIRAARMPED
ncbi:MAG: hypothetical protein PsegKO_34290 [Pseudohongiellaceae bacterium]|jgi:enamine deaminase RidA (YjgF/YER057c/UK114 family)